MAQLSRRDRKNENKRRTRQIAYHACDIKTIDSLDKPVDNLDLLQQIDPVFKTILEQRKSK